MVDMRVVSIEETMLWISLRAVMRASTSSTARGMTVPVTAGTIVRTVLLRATAMLMRDDSTVGTTDVVTSDAMPAAREIECEQGSSQGIWREDILMDIRSDVTEVLRVVIEPVMAVMTELLFLERTSAGESATPPISPVTVSTTGLDLIVPVRLETASFFCTPEVVTDSARPVTLLTTGKVSAVPERSDTTSFL